MAAAIIFFIAAAIISAEKVKFLSYTLPADGKVVEIVEKEISRTYRGFINLSKKVEITVIEYFDESGRSFKIEESPFFSKSPFKVGLIVKVRYDKEDSSYGFVRGFFKDYGFVTLLYLTGVGFLLAFFIMRRKTRIFQNINNKKV